MHYIIISQANNEVLATGELDSDSVTFFTSLTRGKIDGIFSIKEVYSNFDPASMFYGIVTDNALPAGISVDSELTSTLYATLFAAQLLVTNQTQDEVIVTRAIPTPLQEVAVELPEVIYPAYNNEIQKIAIWHTAELPNGIAEAEALPAGFRVLPNSLLVQEPSLGIDLPFINATGNPVPLNDIIGPDKAAITVEDATFLRDRVKSNTSSLIEQYYADHNGQQLILDCMKQLIDQNATVRDSTNGTTFNTFYNEVNRLRTQEQTELTKINNAKTNQ